jgi:F-type H+-transporting ATPase subunit delta
MATSTDSLARVYARSLFELAEQAGGHDKIVEIGEELEQVCELARSQRSLGEFLRSPIVNRAARARSISTVFSDRLTDLTLRFLLVLNERDRLGRLESIAAAYDHMVQQAFGRVEVDVFTPQPLTEGLRKRIEARVREALRREPVLYPYTDPAMIGGIRLRIGDQLIDASIATRLRRLRDGMIGRGAARIAERFDRLIDDSRSK